MHKTTAAALEALQCDHKEALVGKGGFWIKGEGFVSLRGVCKRYGIVAQTRAFRGTISSYGDWATVALLNGGDR